MSVSVSLLLQNLLFFLPLYYLRTGTAISNDTPTIKSRFDVFPGISTTFSMTPDNIGTWGLACAVNDHYNAGMKYLYKVNQCGSAANVPSGKPVRTYHIGIIEGEWDYAPNNLYMTFNKPLDSDPM